MLEWVAMPSSRGSSQPRNQTRISYIFMGRRVFFFLPLAPHGLVFYHTCNCIIIAYFLTRLFIETDCPFSGLLLHFLSTKRLKAWLICIQLSSVAQLHLTLCNPMDCSTPGLPVHHQLPELTQTHVYRVSDAIQTSHPLSSPSISPSIRVFSNSFALGKI